MRFMKMILGVVTVFSLLGASGVAMAEGCGDGVILGENYQGGLRVTDEDSCTIIGSSFGGSLRTLNVRNLVLVNNKVGGMIRVDGNAGLGTATVIANTVFGGELLVKDYSTATVIENETLDKQTGNIRVVQNGTANVQKNIAAKNLRCFSNTDTNSFINAAKGRLNCPNSDF